MNGSPIRLIIADDEKLFRQGLVALFGAKPDFEVIGEASDGRVAIDLIAGLQPDVAIIDVHLPIIDGITVARRTRPHYPKTEIVFVVSTHSEEQVREAFGAGGRGYLLRQSDIEELAFAARKAAMGDFYLSGPASNEMVAEYVKPVLRAQQAGGLMTRRERELARLLADGYSTKEAASVLNISVKTAETHRSSIMKKLNAKNVTDIVKYCIRNHIIEP
jgi:DNA-binding NarL/FixJ family response regulator